MRLLFMGKLLVHASRCLTVLLSCPCLSCDYCVYFSE